MTTRRLFLAFVMQAVLVCLTNSELLAVRFADTEYFVDPFLPYTTALGVYTPRFDVTQNATIKVVSCGDAVGGGACYKAVRDKPFEFSFSDDIALPPVGGTLGEGQLDSEFQTQIRQHENWHRAYVRALFNKTVGELESWSESYQSNLVQSKAEAEALGKLDLMNARLGAIDLFYSEHDTQDLWHNSDKHLENILGVNFWRVTNPDWGQDVLVHRELEFP